MRVEANGPSASRSAGNSPPGIPAGGSIAGTL